MGEYEQACAEATSYGNLVAAGLGLGSAAKMTFEKKCRTQEVLLKSDVLHPLSVNFLELGEKLLPGLFIIHIA